MRQAIAYAFGGVCDSHLTAKTAEGVLAAADYAGAVMTRYVVEDGSIRDDLLTRKQLRTWVDGSDPLTGEHRGFEMSSPNADLVLDATINAPKSFSIAAMLDPELNAAYEDLQDRLRDRIIHLWQEELNARRGKGGCIREDLARVEVVELKHERSRSLDPHKHRHLWLNVKVQGLDGRWSNVDTRVALRFQNVINAEGDLAARTDPAWATALAAKGFTLNESGEIAQLQHLVRPLSKRSAQIEANKIARTAWWKQQHPGQEPSHDVLNQIDRWAWAANRPNKPGDLNEDDWAALVREELAAVDPALLSARPRIEAAWASIEDLDIELLAAKAIVDADARATGTGGRFSLMDVRAGALRALAATGVIAELTELATIAEQVIAAARAHTVTLLDQPDVPSHIKSRMATSTAALKATIANRIEALSAPGTAAPVEEITAIAHVLDPERLLDNDQTDGASAIAGTASVVAITGGAGTGKTSMLKVASATLRRHGRNMIIVAPTKKASTVAGRETHSAASSLHQLLHDYGWRWNTGIAGNTEWKLLQPGDTDPTTGQYYRGPRTRIRPGDRIVVDEAGMLDLEAANALIDVIHRTGATVAVVGDDYQALPVGHSGAMALFRRSAFEKIELTEIHRFRDPEWADLSARIRDSRGLAESRAIAEEIEQAGHLMLVTSEAEAYQTMVAAWLESSRKAQTIALVTGTHAEAQRVNEAIQARRIESGALDTRTFAVGQSGQPVLVGDVVQTRRNDNASGVENRQNWIIRSITDEHLTLACTSDSSSLRRITREYASANLHLGYASTVYGVQGETTDRAIVGPGVDAAGLYVGLTRGRSRNDAVVIASSVEAAKTELAATMQRQLREETIEKSRLAAREELARAARNGAARPLATVDAPSPTLSR
ncbi:AAA family ATPase [Leifsonia sp. F6_8S_P_1B]|uniref:AAA family ATPase n=1 Tax=Leifsonia williamsii TaxID=3035919 RepID=A0ABT8K6V7_9MICO|nr:AAA family ATPase [Leifsonia williamsii]MDN4613173.1 AAA family ATPase [Leifsonia williamsii]